MFNRGKQTPERRVGLRAHGGPPLLKTIAGKSTVNEVKSHTNDRRRYRAEKLKNVEADSEDDEDSKKPAFRMPVSTDARIHAAPEESESDRLGVMLEASDSSDNEPIPDPIQPSGLGKRGRSIEESRNSTQSNSRKISTMNSAKSKPTPKNGVKKPSVKDGVSVASKAPKTANESSKIVVKGGTLSQSIFGKQRKSKSTYGSQSTPKKLGSYENPLKRQKIPKKLSAKISAADLGSSGDEASALSSFKRIPALDDATFASESPLKKFRSSIIEEAQKTACQFEPTPKKNGFVAPPRLKSPVRDEERKEFRRPPVPSTINDSPYTSFECSSSSGNSKFSETLVASKEHSNGEMSPAQRPDFQFPSRLDKILDSTVLSQLSNTVDQLTSCDRDPPELPGLVSLSTSPIPSQSDMQDFSGMQPVANCPLCGVTVPYELLQNFSSGKHMGLSNQLSFCRYHKKTSATLAYSTAGYPTINWSVLDARIQAHHNFIKSILDNETESHYHKLLVNNVKTGRVTRTLQQAIFAGECDSDSGAEKAQSLTPGYYGSRGLKVISENLMEKFHEDLHQVALDNRLVMKRGLTGYVQEVLVPEITVKLISEDMSIDIEEARQVMRDSVTVGEAVHEEIEEVIVRRDDESDEDDTTFGYD